MRIARSASASRSPALGSAGRPTGRHRISESDLSPGCTSPGSVEVVAGAWAAAVASLASRSVVDRWVTFARRAGGAADRGSSGQGRPEWR
jgi:hypothetical protein